MRWLALGWLALGCLALGCLAPVVVAAEETPAEPRFGGPEAGERAPNLRIRDTRGRELELESLWKERPVVLVTGSYSCPVYRSRGPALQRLSERYGSRAKFIVLYTVEAHPVGSPSPYTGREWVTEENRRQGILVRQPGTFEERARLATECQAALRLEMPFLVDGMDNAAWEKYGSAPNACYLISSKGRVRLRQDWFDPTALERGLLEAFQEEPSRW